MRALTIRQPWPWAGFWEIKRFRMGTTLILHVGCAVVVVVEGGES